MGYLFLTAAIVLELVGTFFLKQSAGFSRLSSAAACLAAYFLCFLALSKSLQTLPLSVVYATWAALGILLSTALAMFFFGERLTGAGILGAALVIAGVVLMNLFGTQH